MAPNSSAALLEALRATLQKVEQSSDLGPDDPALVHLKRILQRRMAALQSTATPDKEIESPPKAVENPAIEVGAEPTLDPNLEPVIHPEDVTPLIVQAASEPPTPSIDSIQIDKSD
jgi:hypothetical protein